MQCNPPESQKESTREKEIQCTTQDLSAFYRFNGSTNYVNQLITKQKNVTPQLDKTVIHCDFVLQLHSKDCWILLLCH